MLWFIDATSNVASTELGSTLLAVGGMQALKKAKWFPLLQEGQKVLNRFVSVIVALGISAGISYTWNPTNHSLLITNLSLSTIGVALFHWVSQYIYQETGYTVLQGLTALQKVAATVQPGPNKPAVAVENVGPAPIK